MPKLTRINHIAITTDSYERSLQLWQECLGLEVKRIEDVPGFNLVVAFLPVGESNVEFLLPRKDWDDVDLVFRQRRGMNHICFEVDDIGAKLLETKRRPAHPGDTRAAPRAQAGLPGPRMHGWHPDRAVRINPRIGTGKN